MLRFKIPFYFFGVICAAQFVYLVHENGIFSLTTLCLFSGCLAIAAILLAYQQTRVSHLAEIEKVQEEKSIIKSRFDECNQTFNSMFDNVSDGIALLNLQLDFFKANNKFCDILGYTPEKIMMWNLDQFVPLPPLSQHVIGINQLIAGKADNYQFKRKLVKKSGEEIWLSATIAIIRDKLLQPHYFILYIRNLTQQKMAEDHLAYLSQHDPLLNIPNRHFFENFVNGLVESQNHQKKFGLLLIDLDNFKNINNAVGFQAGNLLLQVIAMRLKSMLRQSDLVARLNSDEFALVITENVSAETLRIFADKVLSQISSRIQIKNYDLYVTASIGISIYPDDGFISRKLMKHADISLNYAKVHDKNNYQFYSVEMARREKLKLRAKNRLARALTSNEFYLEYQPRFKAVGRGLSCVEVNLCLQNKERASFSLQEMLALTDNTGLAMPIADWVMISALKQLRVWHDTISTEVRMAFGVDAGLIKHHQWVDKLMKAVHELNLPPASLELEINKVLALLLSDEETDSIFQALATLKRAGFSIVLNDGGIYNMLSGQANNYFFNKVKINQKLIGQLSVDDSSASIIATVIAKAAKLGIQTVADGIEDEVQVKLLTNAGCTELQGEFLAPAFTEDKMTEFLTELKRKLHPELFA